MKKKITKINPIPCNIDGSPNLNSPQILRLKINEIIDKINHTNPKNMKKSLDYEEGYADAIKSCQEITSIYIKKVKKYLEALERFYSDE